MTTETTRRRHVEWATAITTGTDLAPTSYELWLLERYVTGKLFLEEVIFLAENYRLYKQH